MSKELNEQELDKIAGGRRPTPLPKSKYNPNDLSEITDADFMANGVDAKLVWQNHCELATPADVCWVSKRFENANNSMIGFYVIVQSNKKAYRIIGNFYNEPECDIKIYDSTHKPTKKGTINERVLVG